MLQLTLFHNFIADHATKTRHNTSKSTSNKTACFSLFSAFEAKSKRQEMLKKTIEFITTANDSDRAALLTHLLSCITPTVNNNVGTEKNTTYINNAADKVFVQQKDNIKALVTNVNFRWFTKNYTDSTLKLLVHLGAIGMVKYQLIILDDSQREQLTEVLDFIKNNQNKTDIVQQEITNITNIAIDKFTNIAIDKFTNIAIDKLQQDNNNNSGIFAITDITDITIQETVAAQSLINEKRAEIIALARSLPTGQELTLGKLYHNDSKKLTQDSKSYDAQAKPSNGVHAITIILRKAANGELFLDTLYHAEAKNSKFNAYVIAQNNVTNPAEVQTSANTNDKPHNIHTGSAKTVKIGAILTSASFLTDSVTAKFMVSSSATQDGSKTYMDNTWHNEMVDIEKFRRVTYPNPHNAKDNTNQPNTTNVVTIAPKIIYISPYAGVTLARVENQEFTKDSLLMQLNDAQCKELSLSLCEHHKASDRDLQWGNIGVKQVNGKIVGSFFDNHDTKAHAFSVNYKKYDLLEQSLEEYANIQIMNRLLKSNKKSDNESDAEYRVRLSKLINDSNAEKNKIIYEKEAQDDRLFQKRITPAQNSMLKLIIITLTIKTKFLPERLMNKSYKDDNTQKITECVRTSNLTFYSLEAEIDKTLTGHNAEAAKTELNSIIDNVLNNYPNSYTEVQFKKALASFIDKHLYRAK